MKHRSIAAEEPHPCLTCINRRTLLKSGAASIVVGVFSDGCTSSEQVDLGSQGNGGGGGNGAGGDAGANGGNGAQGGAAAGTGGGGGSGGTAGGASAGGRGGTVDAGAVDASGGGGATGGVGGAGGGRGGTGGAGRAGGGGGAGAAGGSGGGGGAGAAGGSGGQSGGGAGGSTLAQCPGNIPAGNASKVALGSLHLIVPSLVVVGRDAGGLYAMTGLCTHQGCGMNVVGAASQQSLICPCHGSAFSATGAVTKGPARTPLQHYQLEISATGDLTICTGTPVGSTTRTPG
jgi:Rieske Fe-S protein